MRISQTLLITFIALHTTAARSRRPRPNPVMGALQTILSPANAERTMHMVKMATQHSHGNSINPHNQPTPIQNSPPIIQPEPPCKLPANQIARIPQNPPVNPIILPCPQTPVPPPLVQVPCQFPNQIPVQMPLQLPLQMPNPIPAQIPIQMPIQMPLQMQNPTPVQIPNFTPIQTPTGHLGPVTQRLPEIILPEKPCPCQRELVYPDPAPNCYYSPPFIPPVALPSPEVIGPVALSPAQDTYGYPLPSPAALFNSFLPAASPVSTWTSENIPTACSGAKSQYLRKIPIPPPTL